MIENILQELLERGAKIACKPMDTTCPISRGNAYALAFFMAQLILSVIFWLAYSAYYMLCGRALCEPWIWRTIIHVLALVIGLFWGEIWLYRKRLKRWCEGVLSSYKENVMVFIAKELVQDGLLRSSHVFIMEDIRNKYLEYMLPRELIDYIIGCMEQREYIKVLWWLGRRPLKPTHKLIELARRYYRVSI
ncbi:MAG: hypothetical protein DRJ69_04040 [Thermoprotei archaeon]|nr:MAG: hypothetical protein DRJ69_04040 [Thermoprotei archaeon]